MTYKKKKKFKSSKCYCKIYWICNYIFIINLIKNKIVNYILRKTLNTLINNNHNEKILKYNILYILLIMKYFHY